MSLCAFVPLSMLDVCVLQILIAPDGYTNTW